MIASPVPKPSSADAMQRGPAQHGVLCAHCRVATHPPADPDDAAKLIQRIADLADRTLHAVRQPQAVDPRRVCLDCTVGVGLVGGCAAGKSDQPRGHASPWRARRGAGGLRLGAGRALSGVGHRQLAGARVLGYQSDFICDRCRGDRRRARLAPTGHHQQFFHRPDDAHGRHAQGRRLR